MIPYNHTQDKRLDQYFLTVLQKLQIENLCGHSFKEFKDLLHVSSKSGTREWNYIGNNRNFVYNSCDISDKDTNIHIDYCTWRLPEVFLSRQQKNGDNIHYTCESNNTALKHRRNAIYCDYEMTKETPQIDQNVKIFLQCPKLVVYTEEIQGKIRTHIWLMQSQLPNSDGSRSWASVVAQKTNPPKN